MSDFVRPHRRQPTRLPRPWDSTGKNTGMGCHFLLQCMKVKNESEVAQSCPTLCDPMDYTVHGILQARTLEWVAFPFSRDLPDPGTEPGSPALQADSLLSEPLGKPLERLRLFQKNLFSPPDADHLSVNSSPFATSFPHRWAFLLTLASSVSARYGCPSPPLPHHGSLQTLLLSKS